MSRPKRTTHKAINLALQGGGAHGAFTWGVLDRLLAEPQLEIEAISGTSAGAMNAAVVADGMIVGGCDGARAALTRFWHSIGAVGQLNPIQRTVVDRLLGNWSLDHSPSYVFFDLLSRVSSPYELNPLNINPLREVLNAAVDFERVRSGHQMKIFISATNVETGRVKVFDRSELDADRVMASACLPFLFQAVEIDGVPYWDGGYMGNPVLFPFFDNCASNDVVVVQINPIERKGTPKTARAILNRVNEIAFNSTLLRELRAIDFVDRLLEDGKLDPQLYKHVLMHRIEADTALKSLGASSKLNAELGFLKHLFEIGQTAADTWLEQHFDALGERATLELMSLFQG